LRRRLALRGNARREAPSTARFARAVPLPRSAGEDEDGGMALHFPHGAGPAGAIVCVVLCAGMWLVPASAADAPAGAMSCSGCHPAQAGIDTPVPRLSGQDPAAIVAAMQAFRSGARPATVMDRIAKGFSDDEIKSIAAWYAARR
jgi:cytochrome subunit of sulfide dehydrogenase